jgi:hypothetical protein
MPPQRTASVLRDGERDSGVLLRPSSTAPPDRFSRGGGGATGTACGTVTRGGGAATVRGGGVWTAGVAGVAGVTGVTGVTGVAGAAGRAPGIAVAGGVRMPGDEGSVDRGGVDGARERDPSNIQVGSR